MSTAPLRGPDALDRLLRFAAGSRVDAGFGWLEADGRLRDTVAIPWITARMTHVFALAGLTGREGYDDLTDHGVRALQAELQLPIGRPGPDAPQTYDYCFYALAGASAVTAGRPGAVELLTAATAVLQQVWDDEHSMLVDVGDGAVNPDGSAYRGANANMHGVEALLAVADATGDPVWRERAARISERLIDQAARSNGWRLPEHYDVSWNPLPEYGRDDPAHKFRPYGSTVGHGFEWSRLLLHLRAATSLAGEPVADWLLGASRSMFDQARTDGWAVDGHPGFVYTVGWDGAPVVRTRLHWVVCEALAAAAVLAQESDGGYLEAAAPWWSYAQDVLLDPATGSWRHEVDELGRSASTVWDGQPDAYHLAQALLIDELTSARIPLRGSLAAALSAR